MKGARKVKTNSHIAIADPIRHHHFGDAFPEIELDPLRRRRRDGASLPVCAPREMKSRKGGNDYNVFLEQTNESLAENIRIPDDIWAIQ